MRTPAACSYGAPRISSRTSTSSFCIFLSCLTGYAAREFSGRRPNLPQTASSRWSLGSSTRCGAKLRRCRRTAERWQKKQILVANEDSTPHGSPAHPSGVGNIPLPHGTADLTAAEIRYHDGQRCDLSGREVDLLRYFASHTGRAVSRDELLLHVWRLDPAKMETRTVDMHIANLREKLRDYSGELKVLLTVRGQGYMMADNKNFDRLPCR